jgi:hypothetical protein
VISLTPLGKSAHYALNRRLGGPKSRCGHITEKKNSLVPATHHPNIKVAQTLQVNLHNNLQKSAAAGKMLQKDCAVLSKRISDLIIYLMHKCNKPDLDAVLCNWDLNSPAIKVADEIHTATNIGVKTTISTYKWPVQYTKCST